MIGLGDTPDFAPAFTARGYLLLETGSGDPELDFRKAVAMDPLSRVLHLHLIQHLQSEELWDAALSAAQTAQAQLPADFNLDLVQAKALIHVGRPLEATAILDVTHVLPSENARESHRLYEQAHTMVALNALEDGDLATARHELEKALEWPEALGQGRPYEPEERLIRFLLGRTNELLARTREARTHLQAVVTATGDLAPLSYQGEWNAPANRLDLLAIPAFMAVGPSGHLEPLGWAALDPGGLGDLFETEFPELFQDLEGQMLLRALNIPPLPGR
jgi:tetratricopeptide (TPR) repeat protein